MAPGRIYRRGHPSIKRDPFVRYTRKSSGLGATTTGLSRECTGVLIAEDVVKGVRPIVEITQVLQLEAQHERTIGSYAKIHIFHERFNIARRQDEAFVLILELDEVLDVALAVNVVAHLTQDAPAVCQTQTQR